MKTIVLKKSVVFMPPVDDVKGFLEENLKIAPKGERVIVIDSDDVSIQVSFRGLQKWIPRSWCG